jgi:hypothetical protein
MSIKLEAGNISDDLVDKEELATSLRAPAVKNKSYNKIAVKTRQP